MAAYQPRGADEAPDILPFGGSNVIDSGRGVPLFIPTCAELHADFAPPSAVHYLSGAPPLRRPSPDLDPAAPPDRYDVLSRALSPTEVFVRWIVAGFAVGIAAAILIMRSTV